MSDHANILTGESAARRVAMLIYPGVAPLDVAGPLQVFELCNIMRGRICYEAVTVAPDMAPVPTSIGITFLPSLAMADLALPIDTLLVAGSGNIDAGAAEPVGAWLRLASPRARRFGSICTGAFTLGAAGLIEGKRVTTHWLFAAELARRHPTATVEVDAIYIRDGNLYTSAGITAGIDLGLALVEEDFGREFALEVARHLVLFLKRTQLQAQFSELPAVQRVQNWCLANLSQDLSAAVMAAQAAMSERNFVRVFTRETGQTPRDFVEAVRLQSACRLLEETGMRVGTIAEKVGFGSAVTMRRVFSRRLGVKPEEYRTKFGGLRVEAREPERQRRASRGQPAAPSPMQ